MIPVAVTLVLLAGCGGEETDTDAASDAPIFEKPKPPPSAGPAAEALEAFRGAGLPVREARDTSSQCRSVHKQCATRITTEDISILTFDTRQAQAKYERQTGAAFSSGPVTLSYLAARTPAQAQRRYERVLTRGGP